LKHLSGLYDGQIHYLDGLLENLYQYLTDRRLLEETIIIFTSDHGESLGTHRFIGHGWLHENQTRVPLLIRFPEKFFPPGKIEALVETTDLTPTILDLFGMTIPPVMNGKSLLPLLKNETSQVRETVFTEYYGNNERAHASALRQGPWKVITKDWGRTVHLYNLERDPGEIHSFLYDHPKKEELLRILKKEFWSHRKKEKKYQKTTTQDKKTKQMLRDLGYAE